MHVVSLGLNHRTAPLEVRERLAFSAQQLPEALRTLGTRPGVREALLLSTCNRTEIYLAAADPERALPTVLGFLEDERKLDPASLHHQLYVYVDEDAARHLFEVASGVDSLVTGESQILGQVREAYRCALDTGTVQRYLNELFQQALNVGKRVRTETRIGEGAVSVGSAAVALAGSIFGDLHGKHVLLIGAGKITTLTATHLRAQGCERVFVVNRTYERATELAEELGGTAVPWENLPGTVAEADIVISSTTAPRYVLDTSTVKAALKRRRYRPLFLIDLAVPRDIDPAVDRLADIYLYNLDDLSEVVEHNRRSRQQEVDRVKEIAAVEAATYGGWLRAQTAQPVLQQLTEKYEHLSTAEADSVLRKLPSLTPREQELVRAMAKRIRTKILHPVLVTVRELGKAEDAGEELAFIRRLFDLEPGPPRREEP